MIIIVNYYWWLLLMIIDIFRSQMLLNAILYGMKIM
jgi:hypothetical protein